MHSFSKASCAAKPFRLLIWTVSEIIVAAACLLCLFPLFSTGPLAEVCRDCCLVSGAYDGRNGSGIFYKDAGGLRQKQWMISSDMGCVSGCVGSLEYDDVRDMLDDWGDENSSEWRIVFQSCFVPFRSAGFRFAWFAWTSDFQADRHSGRSARGEPESRLWRVFANGARRNDRAPNCWKAGVPVPSRCRSLRFGHFRRRAAGT